MSIVNITIQQGSNINTVVSSPVRKATVVVGNLGRKVNVTVGALTKKTNVTVKYGIKGDPGTITNLVKNEVPAGLVNSNNATFISAYPFVPESVDVYINGYKLTLIDDFNTSGNNIIQLTSSPLTGEKVTINYLKL